MSDFQPDSATLRKWRENELFQGQKRRRLLATLCARIVRRALDEEQGPKVLFSDSTETVVLADLSGDRLTDIVRLRNGEVCYLPSPAHIRFGAKVTMDHRRGSTGRNCSAATAFGWLTSMARARLTLFILPAKLCMCIFTSLGTRGAVAGS